ncbi:hypothetical protein FALCPG4_011507 [Fusarium falciforme]
MPFPGRNTTKRTRPCGPWDVRRKGHRCQGCRSARVRCDGGRPCSRCQLRWLPCTEPNGPAKSEALVFLGQPNSLAMPSSEDAQHIKSFFALMEPSSSPLTDSFSQFALAHFLDTSFPVRLIVSSIGRVRLHCMKTKSYDTPIKTLSWIPETRNEIRRHIQPASGTVNLSPEARSLILLLTALSCIFELMIDDSGYGAILVINSLPAQVVECLHTGPPLSHIETCLLAVYQYFQATLSLVCDQDTFLADILRREQTLRINADESLGLTAAHLVSQFLALFARCNARSIQWLRQARGLVQARQLVDPSSASLQETLDTSCLDFGKVIFESSSELLELAASICPDPAGTPVDPEEFRSFLTAFYHCAIISVARLFTDALWTCVGRPPAVDEIPHLESHALAALAILERRLLSISAESVFYLPLMLAIALEIRQPEDKRRVMEVLDGVASKGFVVARTYKSDIQLAWDLCDSEFANLDPGSGSQSFGE